MFEQNEAVKAMTDEQLAFTIATADKKTFLHFQAQREFNARHNGGKRRISEVGTSDDFMAGMPEYSNDFYRKEITR